MFSFLKRKFGTLVRRRDRDAQINEALLKALGQNLSVLAHVTNKIGLDPMFWKGSTQFITTEFAQ